jgi:hypothetical protein
MVRVLSGATNAKWDIARGKGAASAAMAAAAHCSTDDAEEMRACATANDVLARAQSFSPGSKAALAKHLRRVVRAIEREVRAVAA